MTRGRFFDEGVIVLLALQRPLSSCLSILLPHADLRALSASLARVVRYCLSC